MTWRAWLEWAFRPRNPTAALFDKALLAIAVVAVLAGSLAVFVANPLAEPTLLGGTD
jgi:hypothetical protein